MLNVLVIAAPSQAQTTVSSKDFASSIKAGMKTHDIEFLGLFMLDLAQAKGIYVSEDSSSDVALREYELEVLADTGKKYG